MMSEEIEFNQIENVEIKITFLDGTTKDFGEGDISGSFSEWLSDINYEKRSALEEGQDECM
jgi:hypothetical protein